MVIALFGINSFLDYIPSYFSFLGCFQSKTEGVLQSILEVYYKWARRSTSAIYSGIDVLTPIHDIIAYFLLSIFLIWNRVPLIVTKVYKYICSERMNFWYGIIRGHIVSHLYLPCTKLTPSCGLFTFHLCILILYVHYKC